MDTNNRPMTNEKKGNLIINYLPQSFTDHDLYRTFINIGPIKTCRIMRDMKSGYSYGFGFVEYEKVDDAATAIAQLNNLQIQHKKIKVSYARPPSEDIKDTNLYIQHIPRTYTEEQLEAQFALYGTIVHVNLLKDKITGVSRGIGFVRFDKKVEAQAAIQAMHGVPLPGGDTSLVVRIAEDHGKSRGSVMMNNAAAFRGPQNNMPGMIGHPIPNPGFGRGEFNDFNPGFGSSYGRGGFGNAGGKMTSARMGKRYHPMGGNFGNGGYYVPQ